MNIISMIPLPWRVALAAGLLVAFCVVGGCSAWKAYNAGYETAEAKGAAKIESMRSSYAAAYANATKQYADRVTSQAKAAIKVGDNYAAESNNNARAQARLRSQIGSTGNSQYVFDTEFVRMWNEIVRAYPGSDTGAHADDPRSVEGASGTDTPPGAWILGIDAGAKGH